MCWPGAGQKCRAGHNYYRARVADKALDAELSRVAAGVGDDGIGVHDADFGEYSVGWER